MAADGKEVHIESPRDRLAMAPTKGEINAADSALLELPLCGTRFSSRSRISIDTRSRLNNALSIGLLTWSLCDAP